MTLKFRRRFKREVRESRGKIMGTLYSGKMSLVGRYLFHISWMFLVIGPILLSYSKYLITGELENAVLSTETKISHVLWIHMATIGFLIPMGILVSLLLLRKLTKPLSEMATLADLISKGDFTRKINVSRRDELESLGEAFNQMEENLKTMIIRFQGVSEDVALTSAQIQSSAEKVMRHASLQVQHAEKAAGTTVQEVASLQSISNGINVLSSASDAASSSILQMGAAIGEVAASTAGLSSAVETTSSSIIEMTSSIKEVASHVGHLSETANETFQAVNQITGYVNEVEQNAKEAAKISERVSSDAHDLGVRAIVKTIEGMKKIKETVDKSYQVIHRLGKSSEEIGKVLTVIQEITKQTNLLALNAAILAAQAGEQGKGFAVVADEIKKLADRTASSTNEISQLINDVQTETRDAVASIQSGNQSVDEGMRLSLNAGDAVGKILESSRESAGMARKIEETTAEQVKGIREIKEAIGKITSMSQEIVRATQEQRIGGEQIMEATEKMRDITRKVRLSTEEQFQGSRQISEAVENVNSKIQEMAKAINSQKSGAEENRASIAEIKSLAQTHVELANEMARVVGLMVERTGLLENEIRKVKI